MITMRMPTIVKLPPPVGLRFLGGPRSPSARNKWPSRLVVLSAAGAVKSVPEMNEPLTGGPVISTAPPNGYGPLTTAMVSVEV
jgi:hypothetical protein